MKKFLLLFVLLIGNIIPIYADEYSIVFKDDAKDETSDATNATLLEEIVDGKDYVASFSAVSKVYVGQTGLKFGSSKAAGTVTLNLAEVGKVEATGIMVELAQFGSDVMDFSVSINGGTAQALTSGVTLDLDGQEVNSFKFTSTKRVYLKSITVYYGADDERIDPSFVWSADEATVDYTEEEGHIYQLPSIINNIHNLTLTYASDNETVATVDPATGKVNILSIGTAQISAAFIGNDEFKTKTEAYTLIVVPSRAAGFVYGDLTPAIFGNTTSSYDEEEYTSEYKTLITYKATYSSSSGNFAFNLKNTNGGANSGIVVTNNPLRLVLASVLVKGGNSARNLEIFGADKAFEVTTPDWDSYELIGTVGDVNDDVEVELIPEANYEYVAIWPAKGTTKSMQFTSVTLTWKEPTYNIGASASASIEDGVNVLGATFTVYAGENGDEALEADAQELFKVYMVDGDGNQIEVGVAGQRIEYLPYDENATFVVESPVTGRYFEIPAADINGWSSIAAATTSIKSVKYQVVVKDNLDNIMEGELWATIELGTNHDMQGENMIVDFIFNKNEENPYETKFAEGSAHLYWKDNKAYCELKNIKTVPVSQDGNVKDEHLSFENLTIAPLFGFKYILNRQATSAPMRADATSSYATHYVLGKSTNLSHSHLDTNNEVESVNGGVSGVADVIVDGEVVVEFYNLQGVKVEGELAPGLYIRRQGNEATKVLVK